MTKVYEFDGEQYDMTPQGEQELLEAILEAVTTDVWTSQDFQTEGDREAAAESTWQNTSVDLPFWTNIQAIMQDAPTAIEVTIVDVEDD